MVNWMKRQYGADVPIYITENGMSDRNGTLEDGHRVNYYRGYINELMKGAEKFLYMMYYIVYTRFTFNLVQATRKSFNFVFSFLEIYARMVVFATVFKSCFYILLRALIKNTIYTVKNINKQPTFFCSCQLGQSKRQGVHGLVSDGQL